MLVTASFLACFLHLFVGCNCHSLCKGLSAALIHPPPRCHSDPVTPPFPSHASFTPPSTLSSSARSFALRQWLSLPPPSGQNAVIEFFIQVNFKSIKSAGLAGDKASPRSLFIPQAAFLVIQSTLYIIQ